MMVILIDVRQYLIVALDMKQMISLKFGQEFDKAILLPSCLFNLYAEFTSVKSPSHVQLFVTLWTTACQVSLSITNSEVYSDSCPLTWWCHPTISSSVIPLLLLPSIFPSIRVFSSESVLHIRWPKYRSFSFSISLSDEYSGLISFWMDWLDLLALQGMLKTFL